MRLLVIADDLTGASEIAGIGWRHRLEVVLLRHGWRDTGAEMVVIDAATREVEPVRAAAVVRELLRDCPVEQFDLIYKKTDSVLRGPVLAELRAAMDALGRSRALLVPQNPSRGRVVSGRRYTINGVPLHRTGFADDPLFPVRDNDMRALLGVGDGEPLTHLAPHQIPPARGIVTADGASAQDLRELARHADSDTLAAGSGDFFEAVLALLLSRPRPRRTSQSWSFDSFLMACGSLADSSRGAVDRLRAAGWPGFSLPAAPAAVAEALGRYRGAALATSDVTGAVARPTEELARVVRDVLAMRRVEELLITGGATADAVCTALDLHAFAVSGLWVSGVVRLAACDADAPGLTMKPGSYAWPDSLWGSIRAAQTGVTA